MKTELEMIGTEINFTIDNFSGLIDVQEWIAYMDNNDFYYKDSRKKPYMVNTNIKGVYILYNKNKNPIYVGKSKNCIRGRLRTHLISRPNSYDKDWNLYTLRKRTHYKYFSFIETDIELTPFLEYYFIKKYKPKFNIKDNK